MMTPLLQQLVNMFCCLPGVGPKSAQRMAFHLLERNREGGRQLSHLLAEAMLRIHHCESCRNFSEVSLCSLCKNPAREKSIVCVVETPADVLAIEQAGGYRGLYFVLMGHLSPLDGIGPEQLGLDQLVDRVRRESVREMILATNLTVEGEATAHYVAQLMKAQGVSVSRIAHGVPSGGELEYVDGNTLARALQARIPLEFSEQIR